MLEVKCKLKGCGHVIKCYAENKEQAITSHLVNCHPNMQQSQRSRIKLKMLGNVRIESNLSEYKPNTREERDRAKIAGIKS